MIKKFFLNNWIEICLALLLVLQFWLQVYIIPQQKLIIFIVSFLFVAIMIIKKVKSDSGFQKTVDALTESGRHTNQLIKEVGKGKKEADKKIANLEEKNSLVARLIKEGLITEKNVYKIIQKYKFYYLFCYQNVPDRDKVQGILGKTFRNPSLEAVESLGFIKVGTRHNLYVLPFDFLPPRLRNPFTLERVVRRQVVRYWKDFLKYLEKENRVFCTKYLKKYPDPTNCTYMISTSNFHDVIINYVGYNAFSPEFKNLINYQVDINELKKEVSKRKYDIHRFIISISYDLFLVDLPESDKQVFIDKEESIKQKLSITNFTDYKDKESELTLELRKYFSDIKSINYARLISNKSKKYYELFSTLGIGFN